MNLDKLNSKVFVVCPANTATGGPLLLHQLAYKLIQSGIKVYMYYFETENCNMNDPIHQFYKKFEIPYEKSIDDSKNNLIILPEILPEYIFKYKAINKVIWWLSVDNFLVTHSRIPSFSTKRFLGLKKNDNYYTFQKKPIHHHWAQSIYAIDFLKSKKITKIEYLSDYLDSVFLSEVSSLSFDDLNKQNIIAYNPKKGFDITKQLIEFTPQFKWVAIENMTPLEVKDLLFRSKVYIDFGNHPGKDRIPREAAVCGCIVITNKQGSANYFQDVSISDEYKFNKILDEKDAFSNLVEDIFNNFLIHIEKFKSYRELITNEEQKFNTDLNNIINKYFKS
jgi:hypothetical protein